MHLLLLLSGCLYGTDFSVDGDVATMTGEITGRTPDKVAELLDAHPNLSTIVLLDVPGSLDDVANVEAARLVRAAGLATHVPADGEIASGGVDFFCAGVTRSAESGARFGVHSWSGGGVEGWELDRDDPEHELYLDYYVEMGIPEDFYWFTLEAAEARDIHWMSEEELATYGLLTE